MADPLIDYIVDASVIIQHLIDDVHTPNADALFSLVGKSVTLHVPEFCLLECANVLWKRVRFHGLPRETATALLIDLVALPLFITPASPFLARALQIGLLNQLAVYGSIYIALVEHSNYLLITDDIRQERSAGAQGIGTKPLLDFQQA